MNCAVDSHNAVNLNEQPGHASAVYKDDNVIIDFSNFESVLQH